MTLARKFIVSLILSITFIAGVNIAAFYFFYSTNLKDYISEKIQSRDSITIDYINNVIEKQTVDDIDSIFSDTEIEFFELLEKNDGKIPLTKQKNIDVVINYLVKSGISTKYIEEIVPTDNFGKVLEALRDKTSLEYKFVNNMIISILITNIVSIAIIIFCLLIFIRLTLNPIRIVTANIKSAVSSKNIIGDDDTIEIKYHNKKDEIGLLITAINKLNKKLNMQAEIRSRLLADISHELKTPITSIQCYLEGILDGVIKLDQKNLISITDEMKRLISLVNRIMDFERSDKEKLNIVTTEQNVSDLIKKVVETHKKSLRENKQRIKISGDENLILKFDENLFKQVVHNMIGNFLKYAGKNTLLTINITKKYIDFSDNGDGIKSSEVPFLTEKFYQGKIEKTGDISSRGIGVGLSIISKIILSHGWKYEIKSDKGKGFSFKIYF
ncbi:MAG: HAMP domain-containing sensor histidine kinase [Candidatus Gracilibacteria bacterium]|nr:HAMP domain-containing sensor histidine kinase [Candidatus Gracilibacteria bacterium]